MRAPQGTVSDQGTSQVIPVGSRLPSSVTCSNEGRVDD